MCRARAGLTFKRPSHHAQHHAKVSHAEIVLVLQVDKLALICTYTAWVAVQVLLYSLL